MEFHKYLRLLLVFCALAFLAESLAGYYADEQDARGRAISSFLDYHHSLDVAPEDARFFEVNVTNIDVLFSADILEINNCRELKK